MRTTGQYEDGTKRKAYVKGWPPGTGRALAVAQLESTRQAHVPDTFMQRAAWHPADAACSVTPQPNALVLAGRLVQHSDLWLFVRRAALPRGIVRATRAACIFCRAGARRSALQVHPKKTRTGTAQR
jgi:hypothetical protein